MCSQLDHRQGFTGRETKKRGTTVDVHRTYIPAAGHDWTLPFYDPLVRLLGGDSARLDLVQQAALQPSHRVLEVGCGTGTLLLMIKRHHPRVTVTGLDPDPRALARAQQKADAASVPIQLDRGFSDVLPYPDESFDRVFSSFMFHHLTGVEQKQQTLIEIRRVLKPGGRLELLDFAPLDSSEAGVSRWLHSSRLLRDNVESRVLSLMRDARLVEPKTVRRASLFFVFHTAYYQATAGHGSHA
jgi:ubiquinone/menaquinone biosynthesis C-methylase UbiE